MSHATQKWAKGLLCAALVCLLALPAGCSPKGQIQETPNHIAKPLSKPHELKEWNESQYRRPASVQLGYDAQLAKQFPGVFYYQGPTDKKQVALTFDDGPDNHYTPQILNILHDKKVPATFFIVGENAQMFPDVLRRIVREGHTLGNHTFDHPRIPTLSNEGVTEEIQKTQTVIQKITGVKTDLFRPPYEFLHDRDVPLIHQLGYTIINGSLDTADYRNSSPVQILSNIRTTLKPGSIILANSMATKPHELDGLIQALPQLIDNVRAQGYQFVTVPTLIGR